ncbi:MAG: (Fe-S)-binding protein [Methylococcaceae bacterium]|nr:(Fe-S)-binding protein [Methylococcaceae bacterium]
MNASKLFADTDLCVKCGLCVSHCPTYRKTLDENESPRGRISLIQAWSTGDLDDTPALRRHLDNCLLCRTCESVCPARVPYSKLVDNFRSAAGKGKESIAVKGLSALSRMILPNKRLSGIAARVARTVRSSKLVPLLSGQFPAAHRLQSLLEDINPRSTRTAFHPTLFPKQGLAGLFSGCTGDLFDAATIDAAIRVLNQLGYDVLIPSKQNCCGALHLHSGDAVRAAGLAAGNLRAFEQAEFDVIVTLASGCGAMLKEYPAYFPDSENFSPKIIDIGELVYRSECFSRIRLEALAADILIHSPCSLANVLKSAEAPRKLIEAIPNARVSPLDHSLGCCGAAGNYMLEHPQMADALRQDLLDIIAEKKPDYLLTSNVGCALHLRSGLRQQGIATEVLHPIVLFDRQVGTSEAR